MDRDFSRHPHDTPPLLLLRHPGVFGVRRMLRTLARGILAPLQTSHVLLLCAGPAESTESTLHRLAW